MREDVEAIVAEAKMMLFRENTDAIISKSRDEAKSKARAGAKEREDVKYGKGIGTNKSRDDKAS